MFSDTNLVVHAMNTHLYMIKNLPRGKLILIMKQSKRSTKGLKMRFIISIFAPSVLMFVIISPTLFDLQLVVCIEQFHDILSLCLTTFIIIC